jgi:GGDEF domain-containing protein
VAREGIQIMQPHHVSVYRYGGEEFAVIFQAEQMSLRSHYWKPGVPPLKNASGGKKTCGLRSAAVWGVAF